MKILSTEGLTKLIQLIKSSFISIDDTVTTNTTELADVATSGIISDLSDVEITNVQNQQILSYNSTTQKWENTTGGGGSITVDQTFNGTSTNAQSGVAIAGELDNYQSLVTSTNMLGSDLIDDTNNTHKFATSAQLTQIGTNQTNISTIEGKIPSQASTSNQLADKAFVNNSVQTATANFRGNWNTWTLVPTSASSYPADYAGSTTPTVNDYLVVQDASDYTGDTLEGTWRFKYTGTWSTDGKSGWNPEYQVNETPLTTAQLAALNSGITSSDVTLIGTALQPNDLPTNHVTTDTDQNITGTKTFVGTKKVAFKQSGNSDKLGFTLYTNNNVEKGYLEFNPTNTIDGAPLMTLGNYASSASGITQVGFRRYSSISGANGAYNLLTPLIADAKSPFNLTTTYTNFYLPLGFTDGNSTVKTAKSGLVDLSSILPTVNNSTITFTQGGVTKGTITLNQATNGTIALDAGGSGGIQNTATGTDSLTILGTASTADYSVNIGINSEINADEGVAIGCEASAYSGVAIGRGAEVDSGGGVAIGISAGVSNNGDIAIGDYAGVNGTSAIALGYQASATASNAIQIGNGDNSDANTLQIGNYTLLDTSTGLIPDARISSNIARKADSLVAGNNIIIEEKPSWTKATQVNNLTSERFQNSLAYGNGKFVSISRYGYISTSTDGITWTEDTQISNLNNHNWRAITYGNNKFVAIDFYGYISTSTDGTTWTEATQSTSLGNNTVWHSIAYGNNKFVAVAIGQGGHVSTSTDGITWTEAVQNANLDSCGSLAYGNGEFRAIVLGNNISTSTDGITWTDPSENAKLGINSTWTITFDGTKFVAIEQVYGAISTYNNYEWTPPVFNGNLYQKASWLYGFTFGDNKLVAIGIGDGSYNYVSVCDYSKNSNVISNIFGVDKEFNPSSENAVSGQAIANTFVPKDAGNYHIANSTNSITLTYTDNDSHPTKQYGLGVSEQMGVMAAVMDMTDQTSPKMLMAGLTSDGITIKQGQQQALLTLSSNNNLVVNNNELATQTWVTNQGYITSASLPTMTYTSTTETLTFS